MKMSTLLSALVAALWWVAMPMMATAAEAGSPKALKEDSIARLEAAKPGVPSVDNKINSIIHHIEKSLNSVNKALFLDDNRIDAQFGQQVFEHELDAVMAIQQELPLQQLPLSVLQAMSACVVDLVEADRLIAQRALTAASLYAGASSPNVVSAQQQYDTGLAQQAANNPTSAIQAFLSSWQSVLNITNQPFKLQITQFSDSPDPISPNGDANRDSSTLSLQTQHHAPVANGNGENHFLDTEIRIFNGSHQLIRTLTQRITVTGGQSLFSSQVNWNGQDSSNVTVPDGQYSYVSVAKLIRRKSNGSEDQRAVTFPVSGTITVDNTLPAIIITEPSDASITSDNTPTLRVEYGDVGGLALSTLVIIIDSINQTSHFTIQPTYAEWQLGAADSLIEGNHTITASVEDIAGNAAAAAIQFVVDTVAPQITNVTPPDGSQLTTPRPTLSADFSDATSGINLSTVVILLDGDDITLAAQPSTAGFSYTPTSDMNDGGHTLSIHVADLAGNPADVISTFVIDATRPAIAILSPVDQTTIDTALPEIAIDFSDAGSEIDLSSLSILVNGNEQVDEFTVTLTSASWQLLAGDELPEGINTIQATVADLAGNEQVTSISFTITLIPPAEVSLQFPQKGTGFGGSSVKFVGKNFTNPPVHTVLFGENPAEFSILSDTVLIAIAPPGQGTVDVIFERSPGVVIGEFTYGSFTLPGLVDFESKREFHSNTHPLDITLADFDGDELIDMATADQLGGTVSILRNITDGTGVVNFAPRISYPTGTQTRGITYADFDNDSKLDLVSVNLLSGVITLFRNVSTGIGDISFSPVATLTAPAGSWPFTVKVADFDADGKTDLAATLFMGNSVLLFSNSSSGPGNISFTSVGTLAAGLRPADMMIDDYDNDGKPDLATADSSSNTISVYHNTTTGPGMISFAPRISFATGAASPTGLTKGDFDGDDKVDLAVAHLANNTLLAVFPNTSPAPGTLAFGTRVNLTVAKNSNRLIALDFDGDGRLDIAAVSGSDNVASIFRNSSMAVGTIEFATPFTRRTLTFPTSIDGADLDNDGREDLCVGHDAGSDVVTVYSNISDPSRDEESPVAEIVTPHARPDRGMAFDDSVLPIAVQASDDLGIALVKVYARYNNDAEFLVGEDFTFPYEFSTVIPAGIGSADPVNPSLLTLRAEVRDLLGQQGYSADNLVEIQPKPVIGVVAYELTLAETFVAGSDQTVTVRAVDATGATVTSYLGDVRFRSSDPLFFDPDMDPVPTASFTSMNQGQITVTMRLTGGQIKTLSRAGSQVLSIEEDEFSGGNPAIYGVTSAIVTPAAASQFITGSAGQVDLNQPLTLQLADFAGNAVSSYGTNADVTFTPLPSGSSTSTSGSTDDKGIIAIPFPTGSDSDTYDVDVDSIVPPSTLEFVSTGVFVSIQTSATIVQAGVPVDLIVSVTDAGGSPLTNFTGEILITNDMETVSNQGWGFFGTSLPSLEIPVVFTESEGGVKRIPAAMYFRSAGQQHVNAYLGAGFTSDTVPVGRSNNVTVMPGYAIAGAVENGGQFFGGNLINGSLGTTPSLIVFDAWGNPIFDAEVRIEIDIPGGGTKIFTLRTDFRGSIHFAYHHDFPNPNLINSVVTRVFISGMPIFDQSPWIDTHPFVQNSHQLLFIDTTDPDQHITFPTPIPDRRAYYSEADLPYEIELPPVTYTMEIEVFRNPQSAFNSLPAAQRAVVNNFFNNDYLVQQQMQYRISYFVSNSDAMELDVTGMQVDGPAIPDGLTEFSYTIETSGNQGFNGFGWTEPMTEPTDPDSMVTTSATFTISGVKVIIHGKHLPWGEPYNTLDPLYAWSSVTYRPTDLSRVLASPDPILYSSLSNNGNIPLATTLDTVNYQARPVLQFELREYLGLLPYTEWAPVSDGSPVMSFRPQDESDENYRIPIYDALSNPVELYQTLMHYSGFSSREGSDPFVAEYIDSHLFEFMVKGDAAFGFPADSTIPGFTLEVVDAGGTPINIPGSRIEDIPVQIVVPEVYRSQSKFIALSEPLGADGIAGKGLQLGSSENIAIATPEAIMPGNEGTVRVRVTDVDGNPAVGVAVSVEAGLPKFDSNGVAIVVDGEIQIVNDPGMIVGLAPLTDANGRTEFTIEAADFGARIIQVSVTVAGVGEVSASGQTLILSKSLIPIVCPPNVGNKIRVTAPVGVLSIETEDERETHYNHMLLEVQPQGEGGFRPAENAIIKGLNPEWRVTVPDWVIGDLRDVVVTVDDGVDETEDAVTQDLGTLATAINEFTGVGQGVATVKFRMPSSTTPGIGLRRIEIQAQSQYYPGLPLPPHETVWCMAYGEDVLDLSTGEVVKEGGFVQEVYLPTDSTAMIHAIDDDGFEGDFSIVENRLNLYFATDDPETPANEAVSDAGMSLLLQQHRLRPMGLDRDKGLVSVLYLNGLSSDNIIAERDNPPGQPDVVAATYVPAIQYIQPRILTNGSTLKNLIGQSVVDSLRSIVTVNTEVVTAAIERDVQSVSIAEEIDARLVDPGAYFTPHGFVVHLNQQHSPTNIDGITVDFIRASDNATVTGVFTETSPSSSIFVGDGSDYDGTITLQFDHSGTLQADRFDGIFTHVSVDFLDTSIRDLETSVVETTPDSLVFKPQQAKAQVAFTSEVTPFSQDQFILTVVHSNGAQEIITFNETADDSQEFNSGGAETAFLFNSDDGLIPTLSPVLTTVAAEDRIGMIVSIPSLGLTDEPLLLMETSGDSLIFENVFQTLPIPTTPFRTESPLGEVPSLQLLDENIREGQQFLIRVVGAGGNQVNVQTLNDAEMVTQEKSLSLSKLTTAYWETAKPVIALTSIPGATFTDRYDATHEWVLDGGIKCLFAGNQRKRKDNVFVFLGDSVTAGMNSLNLVRQFQYGAYPVRLGNRLGGEVTYPKYEKPGRPPNLWNMYRETISLPYNVFEERTATERCRIELPEPPSSFVFERVLAPDRPGHLIELQNLAVPGVEIRHVTEPVAKTVEGREFVRNDGILVPVGSEDEKDDFTRVHREIWDQQNDNAEIQFHTRVGTDNVSGLDQALNQNPNLATIWLGNNDALEAMLSGEVTDGYLTPIHGPFNDHGAPGLNPVANGFEESLNEILQALLLEDRENPDSPVKRSRPDVVVVGVPDLTEAPNFVPVGEPFGTRFPFTMNLVLKDVLNIIGVHLTGFLERSSVDIRIGVPNTALDASLVQQGRHGLRGTFIVGSGEHPANSTVSFVVVASQFAKLLLLRLEEICLEAEAEGESPQAAMLDFLRHGSLQIAVPATHVIDSAERTQIRNRVIEFNASIRQRVEFFNQKIALQSSQPFSDPDHLPAGFDNPVIIADSFTLFNDILQNGREVLGEFERLHLEGDWNGGLFSLDGIHPSLVGHAVIADAILRAVQDAFGDGNLIRDPNNPLQTIMTQKLPRHAERFGGVKERRWFGYSGRDWDPIIRGDPRNYHRVLPD